MINPNEHTNIRVKLMWRQADEIKLRAEILSMEESPKAMFKYSAIYQIDYEQKSAKPIR
jgi:hypothetical protein